MQTFPTKHPAANYPATRGFSKRLAAGEAIASDPAPTVTIAVRRGTDPNVAAMLVGNPQISGTDVLQRVRNGVVGVVYQLTFTINTSLGNVYAADLLLHVRK